jgi:hypothetical protein
MEAVATMPIDEHEHLSPRHFQRLAEFIEGYSGIKIPPTKITMVEGRLRRRLRATGASSLKQYCEYLFDRNGLASETVALIDVMTTNKTEFFREPDHFRFMADRAVPALMSRSAGRARALRVWSAACSIGAEPASVRRRSDRWIEQRRTRTGPPAARSHQDNGAPHGRNDWPADQVQHRDRRGFGSLPRRQCLTGPITQKKTSSTSTVDATTRPSMLSWTARSLAIV